MARTVRDSNLETRTARLKLKAGVIHWRTVTKGIALGYRRGTGGKTSSWIVRWSAGTYKKHTLGQADDYHEADGDKVLTYFQAMDAARQHITDIGKKPQAIYTVADAMREYLEWFEVNRKGVASTTHTINAHILPALGTRPVAELTTREIRKWHEGLAAAPAKMRSKAEGAPNVRETTDPRPRKATANRILTVLKAALNHTWRDGHLPDGVSDEAWRRVKPFRNVDMPKVHHLSEDECTRLLNGCAPDFRKLAKGALFTGGRYGELTSLLVGDFHPDVGTISFRDTKSGKPRHVPLNDEGRTFFDQLTAGRPGRERMFVRADGDPWGTSHQNRPLKAACAAAGIEPIGFHVLRHTYGSALAMRGVPLQVIAEVLGHADTRITSRHYAHLMPSYVADTVRANLPSFGSDEPAKVVRLKPKVRKS